MLDSLHPLFLEIQSRLARNMTHKSRNPIKINTQCYCRCITFSRCPIKIHTQYCSSVSKIQSRLPRHITVDISNRCTTFLEIQSRLARNVTHQFRNPIQNNTQCYCLILIITVDSHIACKF
jgi:hypothetical protein